MAEFLVASKPDEEEPLDVSMEGATYASDMVASSNCFEMTIGEGVGYS